MLKRIFSVVLFVLLVTGMLTLALHIQPVRAQETIYINADGSISPSDAPISTVDNITYTFTGNINGSVVIERDDIVVDGAGYILQGLGSVNGIDLSSRSNITSKNTNIKDFSYGILLSKSSRISIFDNSITDNSIGIELGSSSDNRIFGNIITNNSEGVWVYGYGDSNMISENNITNNAYHNIRLTSHSSNNSVNGNIIVNSSSGIGLDSSSNNMISGNNITNNYDGIELGSSSDNMISGNNITASNWAGIGLGYSSNNNTILGNNITANNEYGILVYSSSYNNIICGNGIKDGDNGMYIHNSSNNIVYHNKFMNNTRQVYSDGSPNVWDNSYPSGGNFWNDYNGTDLCSGPYQNGTGSDGIGDTPYVIDANNTDHYPLMKPYVSLLGDVNGDGTVNMKDVMASVQAFNSFPGTARWNPNADLDNSGRVDMRDIVIVVLNFNKHE